MKNIFLFLASIALCSCATALSKPEQATHVPSERIYYHEKDDKNEYAKIVIVRDKVTALWGAIGYHQLFLDGERVASIGNNEKVILRVPAGQHVITILPTLRKDTSEESVGGWNAYQINQILESGETYFFRILIDANAMSRIQRYFPYK